MLKGHVFKKQIFGNQIFALFINTFLKIRDIIDSGNKAYEDGDYEKCIENYLLLLQSANVHHFFGLKNLVLEVHFLYFLLS